MLTEVGETTMGFLWGIEQDHPQFVHHGVNRGMTNDMREQPQAAPLTGLAVGDALGMPFETAHFLENRLLSWDGSYQSSAFHKLQPGQWTDDTMMAKTVALSLLTNKGYNPLDISARYVDWYNSGQHRGMGSNTSKALRKLSQGTPWFCSGIPEAEGNAPAMRGVVFGIYYRNSHTILRRAAASETSITHGSPLAQQGAIAAALGVALLAKGTYHHDQPNNLAQRVAFWLDDGPMKYRLLSVAAKAKKKYATPWQELAEIGTGPHILQTVPAAFFAFMVTTSFQDAIQVAIRAGGDTDSTAALAGALAGTYYGYDQVAPYTVQLEAADELRHLERRLFDEALELPQ